jgi:hypothetical protein
VTARDGWVALFESRARGWQARDPALLAASHADDGVIVSPIFGTVSGREAIDTSYRELFRRFADWTLEAEAPIIDGLRAGQLFRVHATHTDDIFGLAATGRRFEIQGALVFDLREGRIVQERRIYDFPGLLLQLGVLKAKPQ